ncbi:MAG: arsenic resistance protein [Comamonas sp.]
MKDTLERWQALLYAAAVALGMLLGLVLPGAAHWQHAINPALAVMLFVTFLQVPLSQLARAWQQPRFMGALLLTNFVAVPALVWMLQPLWPSDQLMLLGVLLVLLAPCVDYVVTFAYLGKADAASLLAATPVLLLLQMVLLPVYVPWFMGAQAAQGLQVSTLVMAFVTLIALPLLLAATVQTLAPRCAPLARMEHVLGLAPVPATALVLLVVMVAVMPQLDAARHAAWAVLPLYLAFAVLAPWVSWLVGRAVGTAPAATRAVMFSGSTRNALVVLPMALAVPGAMPVLPAVIVMQTLVELVFELLYVRWFPRWVKEGLPSKVRREVG